jgi:nicotinic acid mononucleotide adenylyltransferase
MCGFSQVLIVAIRLSRFRVNDDLRSVRHFLMTFRQMVYYSELTKPSSTETSDTVHEFADMHPNRRFRWVFGADSVATMHEWEGGDWMLENLDMLLIARRGAVAPNLGANALFLTVHTGNESSTELRRRIASQEPYGDMVGPAVYRELVSVGAY